MSIVLNFIIFITISSCCASVFEDYNEENPNYEHIKQQIINLQSAQRSINKKSDDYTATAPLSGEKLQEYLGQLKEDYSRIQNWPTAKKLGAVSAVALDVYQNVVVFHRADRIWNSETFDITNVFKQRNLGPIKENTLITFHRETGNVLTEWGSNIFFMPHGLHINGKYFYITDVALHQVFRFNINNSTTKPELTLGQAFIPGKSNLFCKPTSVASLENGDFFVADGYCNTRIIKFNFKGEKIMEWGKNTFSGSSQNVVEPPNAFAIPHALTLVKEKELLCVADRENGRVQCFSWSDGKFDSQYHSPVVGDRLFSVDYANGSLFVVNGPEFRDEVIEIRGYVFEMASGDVKSKFGRFHDPHDIAVTPDAKEIYVADLTADKNGRRIHKFMLSGLKPMTTSGENLSSTPLKAAVRRGDTALLVGSIVLLFTIFTVGITILIARKKRRGSKIFVKPWDITTKNIFYDNNQFVKIPQNDDFDIENHDEFA